LLIGASTTAADAQSISADTAIAEVEPGDGPAWGTLSGLTAHPVDPRRLYAVTDEDSPPARIIEIEITQEGARAVRQIVITGSDLSDLDCEGVVAKPDGGFWIASEGGAGDAPPNRILDVDAAGRVVRTMTLPTSISSRIVEKGLEGIALARFQERDVILVAFQGPLGGDPDDRARIGMLDPATSTWSFWHYPLERLASGKVTGLSELLHLGGERFAAIERDGKGGRRAVKWVTLIDIPLAGGAEADAHPPLLTKRDAFNLVEIFLDADHKVEKEVEGLALAADGQVYAVTDNDNERPTVLIRLGRLAGMPPSEPSPAISVPATSTTR